ncbi:VOC family protein [Pseudomonadota bacterium]
MIEIDTVDHIGIRVSDLDRAVAFYELLGFEVFVRATGDAVVIMRNPYGIELNLIYNATDTNAGRNVLMDVDEKYPGYTHIALGVTSLPNTIRFLKDNSIVITQGPVDFGGGQVAVFIRDPDLNVIELRGTEREDTVIEGVAPYIP